MEIKKSSVLLIYNVSEKFSNVHENPIHNTISDSIDNCYFLPCIPLYHIKLSKTKFTI